MQVYMFSLYSINHQNVCVLCIYSHVYINFIYVRTYYISTQWICNSASVIYLFTDVFVILEIEDEILFRVSNSEGNPVDDVELIKALEASKLKSQEITAKVMSAEQTERDIDVTRSQYIPVAMRTQILF